MCKDTLFAKICSNASTNEHGSIDSEVNMSSTASFLGKGKRNKKTQKIELKENQYLFSDFAFCATIPYFAFHLLTNRSFRSHLSSLGVPAAKVPALLHTSQCNLIREIGTAASPTTVCVIGLCMYST